MLIDRFFKKGRDFLGCKFPIMCGAMTWVSDPKLIGTVCNAGGFGLLAGGNAPIEVLKKQILETRELTNCPFGVNIITLAPTYTDQLNLVCDLGCEFIVFAGGIAKRKEISQAKTSGAKVICFASTAPLARMLIDRGVDAIMLEGSEAGGHIGPVALSVLIQQILFEVIHVPIFIGGDRHRPNDGLSADDGRCGHTDGYPFCDVRRVLRASKVQGCFSASESQRRHGNATVRQPPAGYPGSGTQK